MIHRLPKRCQRGAALVIRTRKMSKVKVELGVDQGEYKTISTISLLQHRTLTTFKKLNSNPKMSMLINNENDNDYDKYTEILFIYFFEVAQNRGESISN